MGHRSIREFTTGATRDTAEGKYDYEGFLSPLVLECFAAYMHKNRVQADGSLRDGDNWQKGIPRDVYMKSLWRHFMEVWKGHRGLVDSETLIEALCAVLFNVQGYLHEMLVKRHATVHSPVLNLHELEKEYGDQGYMLAPDLTPYASAGTRDVRAPRAEGNES